MGGLLTTLLAAFVDADVICSTVASALQASCSECSPSFVSGEGFFSVGLGIDATCTAFGQTIGVEASTAAPNVWEPLFGGLGVFDPIEATVSLTVNLAGLGSADITIESTTQAFASPPTSDVTDASATVNDPPFPTTCAFADPLLTCTATLPMSQVFYCFNVDDFSIGCKV